jgi:hypothetical protein
VIVELPVTQRAGGKQDGPATVSHSIPSGASPTQMPGVCPAAPKHTDAPVQSTTALLIVPHWPPAIAYVTAAQVFVVVLQ